MPTENGFLGIPQPQRAPDGGGGRGFLRRIGAGFVRGAVPDNAVQGVTGALGGPPALVGRGIGNAVREGIGGSTWFNNLQDAARNLFNRDGNNNNNRRTETPTAQTPTFMTRQPSAPSRSAPPPQQMGPPSSANQYTHMPDPNAGPPAPPPTRGFPLPNLGPAPARGANRGNTTIATGDAAVNFARGIGFSNSGLGGGAGGGGGASSYGRDQLNSQWREA